jgi:hypothetical protein
MKVTMKTMVFYYKSEYVQTPRYFMSDIPHHQHSPDFVMVREIEVEADIPDDFDPRPQQIAALRGQKEKLQAEAQLKINNIDEQIQKLLCLEYKPNAVAPSQA